MNLYSLKKLTVFYFLSFIFFLSFSTAAFSRQETEPEERGQEASASEAQATLASLFGRGAKMTALPDIRGTIALPAFDHSRMKIDEEGLTDAERQKKTSEN